jgi:hypothetical protein
MSWRYLTFVILWTALTAVGVAASHLAADLVWFGVSSRWLFPLVPFGGATLGLLTGVLQWLAISRRIRHSESWMLATAAGWAGSWAVGSTAAMVIAAPGGDLRFFLAMACGTPVVGLAQRHFLRGWSTRADSWLVPSAVGWIALIGVEVFGARLLEPVSALASQLVDRITGFQPSSTVGASVAGGLLLGVITGTAMARMLDAPGMTRPLSVRS